MLSDTRADEQRTEALRLASGVQGTNTADAVVKRAQEYYAFLKGEAKDEAND